MIGYYGRLEPEAQEYTWLQNPRRALSPVYAAAEILWYWSRVDNIDMIKYYAPQYQRFSNRGKAYGAYGMRFAWQGGDLLKRAVTFLEEKPDTRQCVVPIWQPSDLREAMSGEWNDIPCTVCMHFLRRNEQLHLEVYMRSNDLWLGLPYDVFAFTAIQRVLAGELQIAVGSYGHHVGSLHLYERHYKAACEAVTVHQRPGIDLPHNWNREHDGFIPADNAVLMEENIRTGKPGLPKAFNPMLGPMTRDLILAIRAYHDLQHGHRYRPNFKSESLREGWETYVNSRRPGPSGQDNPVQEAGGQ